MPPKKSASAMPSRHELVITRVFNAPRDLVFSAWTEPEHLAHWSGPAGFTTPHHEMDLRPGGRYRACLRSPEGTDHWVQGEYLEVVPPERLSMTHAWEDAAGLPGPVSTVTVTFTAQGDKTLMTFRQSPFESGSSRDGHAAGWSSSFDKLQDYLAGTGP